MSTQMSPYEILFGVKSTMSVDIGLIQLEEDPLEVLDHIRRLEVARTLAMANLEATQVVQKKGFDRRHQNLNLAVGDEVLIFDAVRRVGVCEKLRPKWSKRGHVVRKINKSQYVVQVGEKLIRYKVDFLRKFVERQEDRKKIE
ncbi:hypothetical protein BC332_34966 [Capsicum chinense]|nr:hypothetical protein BC332_34966 [Capsicum chinense]